MAELLGVARDESSLSPKKNGQGRCKIALSSFVDNDEAKDLRLKGKNAMDVVGGGDPNGKAGNEGLEIKGKELFLLGGCVASCDGLAVAFEVGEGFFAFKVLLYVMVMGDPAEGFEKFKSLVLFGGNRFEKFGQQGVAINHPAVIPEGESLAK